MNIRDLDLNLLRVLDALLLERHVTRAARRVGLSQSAMSNALARLRDFTADPLFVRSAGQMTPTEHALALAGPVREALSTLEDAFLGGARFDARQTVRRFRIASADYSDFVLFPELMTRLGRVAPRVAIDGVPIPGRLPDDALRTGTLDAAIGSFSQIPSDCRMTELFEEDFVCIARNAHPRIHSRIGLKTFSELGHVLVTPLGTPGGLVDDLLAARGLERHVAFSTPHFLVPPRIVATTDLVCTLAGRVGRHFAETYPIRALRPPLPVPGFPMRLVWHRRSDESVAHQWLRKEICDVAQAVA